MKVRRFYPKQVMRRLADRDVGTLDGGEKAALIFFMRRARKYGIVIAVVNEARHADLLKEGSAQEADSVIQSAPSRIHLNAA